MKPAFSGLPATSGAATDDPVFAAIERHRRAAQTLSTLHKPPDALVRQLARAEGDAFLAWLTTPPTTLAGAIATLDHASRRPYYDADCTNLLESVQYAGRLAAAGERFPAMIAAALRKMVADKLL